MSDAFDPYYIWLGIPPEDQPPNHYRLLGVTLFESNREVIEAAANRQMAYMQEISGGEEHIDEAQNILGELSRARVCLLNDEKKAAYDAELRASFDAIAPAPESTAEQTPAASATPTADDSLIPPQFGLPDDEAGTVTEAPTIGQAKHRPHATGKSKKKQGLGPIIGLAVVLLILLVGGIAFFLSSRAEKFEGERTAEIVKKEKAAKIERQAQAEAKGGKKEEAKRKAKLEAAQKAKEEAKRKAKQEAEQKAEADRKAKAEADRKAQEEAEQKAKTDAARTTLLEIGLEEKTPNPPTWSLNQSKINAFETLNKREKIEEISELQSSRQKLEAEYHRIEKDKNALDAIKILKATLSPLPPLIPWTEEYENSLTENGFVRQEGEANLWAHEDFEEFTLLVSQIEAAIEAIKKAKTTSKNNPEDIKKQQSEIAKQTEQAVALYDKLIAADNTLKQDSSLQTALDKLGATVPKIEKTHWKQLARKSANITTKKPKSPRRSRVPKPVWTSTKKESQQVNNPQKFFPPKFSVEAIVQLTQGTRYGGIAGIIRDNGQDERGWLLGYNQTRFTFALRSQSRAKLQYLTGKTAFTPNKIHHVLATYNGNLMTLYVDGKPDAKTDKQRGAVVYPPTGHFTIGAYKDENENFPLSGTVHRVNIYKGVLGPGQIQQLYQNFEAQRIKNEQRK